MKSYIILIFFITVLSLQLTFFSLIESSNVNQNAIINLDKRIELIEEGNWELALKSFKKCNTKLQPICNYYLGIIYYNLNEYEDSIKKIHLYLKNNKDIKKSYFYLGLGYFKIEDYDESEKYLLLAEEEDSENGLIKFNLGAVYYNSGEIEKSIPYFKSAMKLENDLEIACRFSLAVAYINLEESEKAKKELNTILKLHPDGAFSETCEKLLQSISD